MIYNASNKGMRTVKIPGSKTTQVEEVEEVQLETMEIETVEERFLASLEIQSLHFGRKTCEEWMETWDKAMVVCFIHTTATGSVQ